jgi:SNF2 family DNA or RNA helicase
MFQDMGFERIILDEAHRIRNMKNITSRNVHLIPALYKWVLTATPIVNTLDDAVSYLKFIGFPVESSSWNPMYETWVRNIYMARTIDQCEAPAGLVMPPTPILETRYLDFTNKEEEKLYSGIYSNLENQWRQAAHKGRAGSLQKLSILLRLRQVSVNPQVYIRARQKEAFGWAGPEFTSVSRKFAEIETLLRASHTKGVSNRWIIFCQFHEEIAMMTSFLKGLGPSVVGTILEYHGGMSFSERDDAIAASHTKSSDGKQDVFLVQLQAGGTGLNLQHYDRVIFTSPWWTAALLDQAIGRAVRIGQAAVVKVYWLKLKTEDLFNIDAFMMDKADEKRDLGKLFLSWSI